MVVRALSGERPAPVSFTLGGGGGLRRGMRPMVTPRRDRSFQIWVVRLLVVAVTGSLCIGSTAAQATHPGGNGRLLVSKRNATGSYQLMNRAGSVITPFMDRFANPPTFSPDGRVAAYTFEGGLWITNQDGDWNRRVSNGGSGRPTWSPDGKRLAVAIGGSLVIVNRKDGSRRSIDFDDEADTVLGPAWSPDGRRIAFTSDIDQNFCRSSSTYDVWSVRPNGRGLKRLTNTRQDEWMGDWSPDGKRITFSRENRCSPDNYDLHTMRRDGSGKRRLTTTRSFERPRYSPNGKWIYSHKCFIRPNGSRYRCLPFDRIGIFDWQPVRGARPASLSINHHRETGTSNGERYHYRVVKGRASSRHEGVPVYVTLLKFKDGRYMPIARRAVGVENDRGRYEAIVPWRRHGRCKLKVRVARDTEYASIKKAVLLPCNSR